MRRVIMMRMALVIPKLLLTHFSRAKKQKIQGFIFHFPPPLRSESIALDDLFSSQSHYSEQILSFRKEASVFQHDATL